MKLPPAWKIRRELYRIKVKFNGRFLLPYLDKMRQFQYDRSAKRTVRETRGALELTERVAILVLFQPQGIAKSVFFTLDHLQQQGWATVVVSNAKLSETDRLEILTRCAYVIERPNIGYDFGAYREGWRWLQWREHVLDRLILMNDSTWFPLRETDDSLRRMEQLGADFAGHIFKTEVAGNPKRDHVESHLLMFSRTAVEHPEVQKFWKQYVMSSDRALTIEKGEKRITQVARSSQLKISALIDRERILGVLDSMSDEEIVQALMSLVLHDKSGRAFRDSLLSNVTSVISVRSKMMEWTNSELSSSLQHLISATFVIPALQYAGMGFLKKSGDPRFQLARLEVLRQIGSKRLAPLDPRVETEVNDTVRSWRPAFDWRRPPSDAEDLCE